MQSKRNDLPSLLRAVNHLSRMVHWQVLILLFPLCFGITPSLFGQVQFRVELLSDNETYQVSFLPAVTWSSETNENLTSTAQVTLVIPTGGFSVDNVQSLVPGASWSNNSSYIAPEENPSMDYVSFGLTTLGTSAFEYEEGVEFGVFTFQNTGNCTGAVELMMENDPFYPPNSQNANVGNQLVTFGSGTNNNAFTGAYAVGQADCLGDRPCILELQLAQLEDGAYQVGFIPDSTLINNTESAQIILVANTGVVEVGAITNIIEEANFLLTDTHIAPTADPSSDYFIFNLASPTNNISYTKGQEIALFSFKNIGECQGGQLRLLNNDNDTFASTNARHQWNAGGVIPNVSVCSVPTRVNLGFDEEIITAYNSTDCGNPNGTITIENPKYEYSIDQGVNWTDTGMFTGLTAGTYDLFTRFSEGSCSAITVRVNLTERSSPMIADVNSSNPQECNGTDGSISITALGGSDNYEYNITNDDNWVRNNIFTGLSAGTYTIRVRNAGTTCSTTGEMITLQTPTAPNITNVSSKNPSECGVDNGEITITTDSERPLEYSIDEGDNWTTTSVFTDLAVGNYQVVVRYTDGTCATEGGEINLLAPTAPQISSIDKVDPSDCGNDNGVIIINADERYEYSINEGTNWQTDSIYNNLSTGTYEILVRTLEGTCESLGGTIELVGPEQPIIEEITTINNDNCTELAGSITIIGNSENLEYSIDKGENFSNTNNFNGLAPERYDIVVRVAGTVDCQATAIAIITGPDEPTIDSVAASDVTVCNGDNGSLSIFATGQNLEYSLDSIRFQRSNTFNNLTAGDYRIIVRDANAPDCIVTDLRSLAEPETPVINEVRFNNPSDCSLADGNINIDATGNDLEYSIDNGETFLTENIFNDLSTGTYYLVIRSNNCDVRDTIQLTEPNQPKIDSIQIVDPMGCGIANGSLAIFPSGDTLMYSIDGGASFQNESFFDNLKSGDYEIVVRNALAENCQTGQTVTLKGESELTINNVTANPSSACGSRDGSIFITTENENVEYSIDGGSFFQTSNAFGSLLSGHYELQLRDPETNCHSAVENIYLPGSEQIEYHIDLQADGRFLVSLTPNITWEYPQNITSTAQITLTVPTGTVTVTEIENLIEDVVFAENSRVNAPEENPERDYIVFGLSSIGTENIPYEQGVKVPLFLFSADANCVNGQVELMRNDDAFSPPNSLNANVGQQLSTFGAGGNATVCAHDAVVCPQINQDDCLADYVLEILPNGHYQVSLLSRMDYEGDDGRTSTAQITLIVPTGGFQIDNLTNLVEDVVFTHTSRFDAPQENPDYDYINFALSTIETNKIPYQMDLKTPLFSFENTGECKEGGIYFMNNDSDPFAAPNSRNANVGMQLSVEGYGENDVPICNTYEGNIEDHLPCVSTEDLTFDEDNDGIMIWEEMGCSASSYKTEGCPSPYEDEDEDEIPNFQDSDFCTLNEFGICIIFDFDDDGLVNWLDIDSDNDGILDYEEAGLPAPTGQDSNFDGIDDAYDMDQGGTMSMPIDTDQDGHPNYLDIDSDNDGISDNIETSPNPLFPDYSIGFDSDQDGLDNAFDPDSGEQALTYEKDFDEDGVADVLDIDSDNDGILDLWEAFLDRRLPVMLSGSDVDQDGLDDTFDRDQGGRAGSIPDTDGDEIPDFLDTDSDNDSLSDVYEASTDPSAPVYPQEIDADEDGLDAAYDSDEGGVLPLVPDYDEDGERDFRDTDSDNDGITDGEECVGGDPCPDLDGNGIPDYLECQDAQLNATQNGPVCSGESATLRAFSTVDNPQYAWRIVGQTNLLTNEPTYTTNALTTTTTFEVTVENGTCLSNDTLQITVEVAETLAFDPNYEVSLNGTCEVASLQLLANVSDSTRTNLLFAWEGPNGYRSSEENPVIARPNANFNGNYNLTITDDKGCQYTSGFFFNEISGGVLQPNISSTGPACEGQTVRLSIPQYEGTSVKYEWTVPDSFAISGLGTNELIISPMNVARHDGSYQVTVTVDGCSATSEVYNLEAYQRLSPRPSVEGAYCAGNTLRLFANTTGAVAYSWTGPNGYTSAARNPFITNINSAYNGTYTLEASNDAGCVYKGFVNILDIQDELEQPTVEADPFLCQGDSIRMFIQQGYSLRADYLWLNAEDVVIGRDRNLVISSNDPAAILPFRARVTVDACEAPLSEKVHIDFYPVPDAIANVDGEICRGDDAQLYADPTEGTRYEWRILGQEEIFSIEQNPIVFNIDQTTEFELRTYYPACDIDDRDTLLVVVSSTPTIAEFTSNNHFCIGSSAVLTAYNSTPGDGNIFYRWVGPNGFEFEGISAPEGPFPAEILDITPAAEGTYKLELREENGCTADIQSVYINVVGHPETPRLNLNANVLCEGEALVLNTEGRTGSSARYNWYFNNGSGDTLLQTTTVPSLLINDIHTVHSGFYSVNVEVGECISANSTLEQVIVFGPSLNLAAMQSKDGQITNESIPVCEGENIQLIIPNFPGINVEWVGPNGYTSNQNSPILLDLTTENNGEYYALIQLEGCATIVTQPTKVRVTPPIEAAILTQTHLELYGEARVCLEYDLILDIANPVTPMVGDSLRFDWYFNNEFLQSTTEPRLLLPMASDSIAGTYQVLTELNTCQSVLSEPLAVAVDEVPTDMVANGGMDSTYCAAYQVQLGAELPRRGSGSWSALTGAMVLDPTNPQTIIENLTEGENIFLWSLHNGACRDYAFDNVVITVANVPTDIADAGADREACGLDLQLDALMPAESIGFWEQSEEQLAAGVSLSDNQSPTPTVMGVQSEQTYQFIWNLVHEECGVYGRDTVNITISPTPNPNDAQVIDPLLTACDGDSVLIAATTPPTGSIGVWTSSNGTIATPNATQTLTADFTTTENVFYWTLSNEYCTDYSQDSVTVFQDTPPVAVNDKIDLVFNDSLIIINVLENDIVNLDAFDFIIKNYPDNGDLVESEDGIFSYEANKNFFGQDTIGYEICSLGCDERCDTAMVIINVSGTSAAGECFFPNIISPNGDRVNDQLKIACIDDYPDNELVIFNRWGRKVFEQERYRNDWEGTWQGKPLPEGVYFYVFKTDAANSEGIQGHFSIFR